MRPRRSPTASRIDRLVTAWWFLPGRGFAGNGCGNRLVSGRFLDDDVVWHTPGRNLLAGTHEGRTETFASFAREFELSGGTYTVEVHDVLANNEHTVALLHATAEREGKRLDQHYVIVFHIHNEMVHEAWELWTDQASLDAFWS